jgi:tetratricopeptide (TPR) repeat protein
MLHSPPRPSLLHALLLCGALAGAASALPPQDTPAGGTPGGNAPPPDAPATEAPAAGDSLAEARAHLAAGRAEEARTLLQGMLALGEGDETAVRVALSEALVMAGEPGDALRTLEPVLDGKAPEVLLAQGRAYRALGDSYPRDGRKDDDIGFAYDEARSYLEAAAKKAPAGDHDAAIELGNLELYIMGDHEAATKRANELLASNKADGEALLLRGCAGVYAVVAEQQAGDEAAAAIVAAKAIQDLLAADKALPKDRPEPWAQLAWLYETTDQQVNAVNAAIKVLDRNPDMNFATLYHLALRYSGEREFEASARALAQMVKRDAAQLAEWVKLEPDVKVAVAQLASSVEALAGQDARLNADARDILAVLLEIEPSEDANLWNNLGLFCRDTQKFEESHKAYSRALELAPDEAGLLNDSAVILHYYLHRDYDTAQEMYERAIELATDELKKKDITADRKAEMEKAKKEATDNLGKLARGDYQWGG